MDSEFMPGEIQQDDHLTDLSIFHNKDSFFESPDFHSHDYYEIFFFLDGVVTYYIEENVYELLPGDILIIPPGKMHRPVITSAEYVYDRIVLWLSAQYIRSLCNGDVSLCTALQDISDANHLIRLDKDAFQEMNGLFLRLMRSARDRNNLLMQAGTITLLSEILSARQNAVPPHNEGVIPAMIAFINEHIQERLDLDLLSARFSISKYHLIRTFKEYTNATVYDYILSKRIIIAKNLISQGVPAVEACRQCGFTDYSNFYKSFIAKTGMTPKEYKVQVRYHISLAINPVGTPII
jgi:AraC-like DNA-binding protein